MNEMEGNEMKWIGMKMKWSGMKMRKREIYFFFGKYRASGVPDFRPVFSV